MFGLFNKTNVIKGERNEDLPLTHEGLPDSYRPNGLCPRCGKQSSFESMGELPVTFSSGMVHPSDGRKPYRSYSDRVTCMVCRHCNQGVVVIEEEWIGEHPSREGIGNGGITSYRGIHWWPLPQSKLSEDIPSTIIDVYAEAVTTYYAQAPRATAVMLRRTIEAIVVYFGEEKGALAQRLQMLSDRNILQPSLADWAKEVRLVGNQGAHFDPAEMVSMDDVTQLILFVQELMKYLFTLPAELLRRRNL
ncbi:MAG: hypothetical protein K0R15_338 [Clostridiales bacterium]|nr:hypothetical protein [Clostridiales bacterium]